MSAPSIYPSAIDSVRTLHRTPHHDNVASVDERDTTGINTYMMERRKYYTDEQWMATIHRFQASTTLYIGNLSFYTTEEQLYEMFGTVGPIKRLVMGLNRLTKTPCGFCFVEYYTHEDAIHCHRSMHGALCDERPITVSIDPGYEEGRQYGRSKRTGGQRRDDFRVEFDPARGGWSTAQQQTEFNAFPMQGGFSSVAQNQNRQDRRGRGAGGGRKRGGKDNRRQSNRKQDTADATPGAAMDAETEQGADAVADSTRYRRDEDATAAADDVDGDSTAIKAADADAVTADEPVKTE